MSLDDVDASEQRTPRKAREADPDGAVTAELVQRLFTIDAAGIAETLESRDGGFSVVRLDEIVAPRIPSVDAVREQAITGWKAERISALAEETAQKIADRARGGTQRRGVEQARARHGRVHLGARLEQHARDVFVAIFHGDMQRRLAPSSDRANAGTRSEQIAHVACQAVRCIEVQHVCGRAVCRVCKRREEAPLFEEKPVP